MAYIDGINDKKYLNNGGKSLLLKEIIVLAVFAALISASILFLFPVINESMFLINTGENADLSGFYYGRNNLVDLNKSGLEALKNAGSGNFSNIKKITAGKNYLEIFPSSNISAVTGNYLKIRLNAKNNESSDFPAGSMNIKWKYENQADYSPLNQESMRIFVDGFSHDYLAAVGENKNWKSNEKIASLLIEVPEVKGVSIKISEISLNKRLIFPLDSFINKFFKENFQIREINRFLTPAYIGLLVILGMVYLLKLVSRRVMTGKIMFNASVIILFIFSIYFFKNEIITVKSYYDSYKKNIRQADLKNTYLGFYDFEKFISWAAKKIPANENLIVLIRGEQVYIESELAYNLYPRDIKFINISQSTTEKIAGEISMINSEASSQNKNYKYLIALSDEDIKDDKILKLQYSYRTDAGLIFIIK
ncbi:MAG: hypothetical protein ACYCXB_08175 [Candidatus Humimicrobiaceae bacterium]